MSLERVRAAEFSLEACKPEHESFLWTLNRLAYEQVVTAQFGSWEPLKQRAFFEHKWQTQSFFIIVSSGAPVGAFSREYSEEGLTLLELLALPAHQNRGIGSRIIQQLQE